MGVGTVRVALRSDPETALNAWLFNLLPGLACAALALAGAVARGLDARAARRATSAAGAVALDCAVGSLVML